jgi:hypothetical protein
MTKCRNAWTNQPRRNMWKDRKRDRWIELPAEIFLLQAGC